MHMVDSIDSVVANIAATVASISIDSRTAAATHQEPQRQDEAVHEDRLDAIGDLWLRGRFVRK